MLHPAVVIDDDEALAVAMSAVASAMADPSRVKNTLRANGWPGMDGD